MIIAATIKMAEAPEHVEELEEQEEQEEQEPQEQEKQQEVKVKKPRAKRVPKAKPPPVVVSTDPPIANADFWRDMLITKREMEKAETRARYANLVILK